MHVRSQGRNVSSCITIHQHHRRSFKINPLQLYCIKKSQRISTLNPPHQEIFLNTLVLEQRTQKCIQSLKAEKRFVHRVLGQRKKYVCKELGQQGRQGKLDSDKAHSIVVGIICPLVEIGLTNSRPKFRHGPGLGGLSSCGAPGQRKTDVCKVLG